MHQAQDMVDLSKRISASLSSSVSSNDNNDSREFSAMLAEFGLMSSDAVLSDSQFSAPVNCSSFIEALAKQVESIIARPMTNRGGHLALTDVYCLVNRVRGTDFVSPDDLIKACRLGKSFHVAKLPSGLLVLRQNELADTSVMAQRIVSCISECSAGKSRGISALELSASMRLSVPLSEEVLLMAESNGVLCRDESDQDGIRFWINIFV
jgi:ESCRT-II complex subunit VPS36